VVAIIGLLAGVILSSLNKARESARQKAAMSQLRAVRSGIALLEADTGKWPNGCSPTATGGTAEVDLNTINAGLKDFPTSGFPITTDGAASPICQWTATDSANWRGPYIYIGVDPWGSQYRFDPDYYTDGSVRRDCPTATYNPPPEITDKKVAIISKGVNKVGGTDAEGYDCDDIVFLLYEGKFVP
jgi:type II secretory pathway pseudopilin PulG